MTRHSPDSDDGRLPENIDNENTEGDEGFRDALTERTIEVENNTDEDEFGNHPNSFNGYEPLPVFAIGAMYEGNQNTDEDEIEFGYSNFDGEQFHVRTSTDYRHLLEEPPVNSSSKDEPALIPMDTARIETIKSIMSNIILPPSVVPNWASTVSDADLTQVLNEKLRKKTGDKEDWAKFD